MALQGRNSRLFEAQQPRRHSDIHGYGGMELMVETPFCTNNISAYLSYRTPLHPGTSDEFCDQDC